MFQDLVFCSSPGAKRFDVYKSDLEDTLLTFIYLTFYPSHGTDGDTMLSWLCRVPKSSFDGSWK